MKRKGAPSPQQKLLRHQKARLLEDTNRVLKFIEETQTQLTELRDGLSRSTDLAVQLIEHGSIVALGEEEWVYEHLPPLLRISGDYKESENHILVELTQYEDVELSVDFEYTGYKFREKKNFEFAAYFRDTILAAVPKETTHFCEPLYTLWLDHHDIELDVERSEPSFDGNGGCGTMLATVTVISLKTNP